MKKDEEELWALLEELEDTPNYYFPGVKKAEETAERIASLENSLEEKEKERAQMVQQLLSERNTSVERRKELVSHYQFHSLKAQNKHLSPHSSSLILPSLSSPPPSSRALSHSLPPTPSSTNTESKAESNRQGDMGGRGDKREELRTSESLEGLLCFLDHSLLQTELEILAQSQLPSPPLPSPSPPPSLPSEPFLNPTLSLPPHSPQHSMEDLWDVLHSLQHSADQIDLTSHHYIEEEEGIEQEEQERKAEAKEEHNNSSEPTLSLSPSPLLELEEEVNKLERVMREREGGKGRREEGVEVVRNILLIAHRYYHLFSEELGENIKLLGGIARETMKIAKGGDMKDSYFHSIYLFLALLHPSSHPSPLHSHPNPHEGEKERTREIIKRAKEEIEKGMGKGGERKEGMVERIETLHTYLLLTLPSPFPFSLLSSLSYSSLAFSTAVANHNVLHFEALAKDIVSLLSNMLTILDKGGREGEGEMEECKKQLESMKTAIPTLHFPALLRSLKALSSHTLYSPHHSQFISQLKALTDGVKRKDEEKYRRSIDGMLVIIDSLLSPPSLSFPPPYSPPLPILPLLNPALQRLHYQKCRALLEKMKQNIETAITEEIINNSNNTNKKGKKEAMRECTTSVCALVSQTKHPQGFVYEKFGENGRQLSEWIVKGMKDSEVGEKVELGSKAVSLIHSCILFLHAFFHHSSSYLPSLSSLCFYYARALLQTINHISP